MAAAKQFICEMANQQTSGQRLAFESIRTVHHTGVRPDGAAYGQRKYQRLRACRIVLPAKGTGGGPPYRVAGLFSPAQSQPTDAPTNRPGWDPSIDQTPQRGAALRLSRAKARKTGRASAGGGVR